MQIVPQKIHNPFDCKTNRKKGHVFLSAISRSFTTTSKFLKNDATHRVLKDLMLNLWLKGSYI
jgi:hypothetical protein